MSFKKRSVELRDIGERLANESGIRFLLVVEGSPRPLEPGTRQECQRIAIEGLSNAFQHSGGTSVELQINYARRAFSLRVSDDGRGFDPDRSYGGHWGLIGMRERAARIQGRLLIHSGAGGTTVTLELPARSAYLAAAAG